jgi:hypothetical protein
MDNRFNDAEWRMLRPLVCLAVHHLDNEED